MCVSVNYITDVQRSAIKISNSLNIRCQIHTCAPITDILCIKRQNIVFFINENEIITPLGVDNICTTALILIVIVQNIVFMNYVAK